MEAMKKHINVKDKKKVYEIVINDGPAKFEGLKCKCGHELPHIIIANKIQDSMKN